MSEANPIKLSLSIFTNFSESLSFSPPFSKSPRNFEQPLVGLGIVAAMSDATEPIDAKIAASPRSEPIPIVSAKSGSVIREPASEDNDDAEVSESYTCVISHVGDEAVRKHEYFDGDDGMRGNYWGWSEVFFSPPPPPAMYGEGFLSCCYLCRKKLHGLDVFIYGGDKAFCSAECRCQQILSDELKEKCGSEAHKSAFDYPAFDYSAFDYSASPCSAPRLFSAGVAAA